MKRPFSLCQVARRSLGTGGQDRISKCHSRFRTQLHKNASAPLEIACVQVDLGREARPPLTPVEEDGDEGAMLTDHFLAHPALDLGSIRLSAAGQLFLPLLLSHLQGQANHDHGALVPQFAPCVVHDLCPQDASCRGAPSCGEIPAVAHDGIFTTAHIAAELQRGWYAQQRGVVDGANKLKLLYEVALVRWWQGVGHRRRYLVPWLEERLIPVRRR